MTGDMFKGLGTTLIILGVMILIVGVALGAGLFFLLGLIL